MDSFLKTGKLGPSSSSSTKDSVKGKKSQKCKGPIPWVEKYRPKTVTEVAHQDEVISVLKKSLEGADLPNLLFYGPPGTGKTSTILAACRDLFGMDMYKERILELNASDERGIAVVRDKIKNFAQLAAGNKRPDGTSCPPFKVIILDEADSMTRDAQSALRRTMEKEGKSTKFCLICNYISRIIEPLTSRCAKFRFKPLAEAVLISRLKSIADKEKLKFDNDNALSALVETSEGDLRKAITSLQSCSRFLASPGDSITAAAVYEMSGKIPEKWISKAVKACESGSYESVEAFADDLSAEGYSAYQLIVQLHDRVVDDDITFDDRQKSMICSTLAINEHRLLEGANEYLQIVDLLCVIMKEMNNNNKKV